MKGYSFARHLMLLFVLAAFATPASAGLVDTLVDQLGITKKQAAGGSGAIFDYAKKNLEPEEFSEIADGVPEMDDLLGAAPKVEKKSTMGQLGGMLGDKGGSAAAIAALADSFEALGLDADMARQFLPVVYDYVQSSAGDAAMGLLKGLF